MRLLLTILITFSTLLSQAQNWNLVNADRQLHYSIDTTAWYDATVLVDSVTTNDPDSIFHLNRIVTECDSCPNSWQFHYLRYNQPTFMQRIAVKNGDSWNLKSPNSFAILPHAQLNQTWLFDTLNNVTAEVTSAMDATVLGTADSIKTISLSSGDSIMISKNFGVIDMGNQSNRWHLMGAELPDTVHGFKLPGFDEFYDIQVGDEIQYRAHHGWAGKDVWYGVYRKTFTGRETSPDTIELSYSIYDGNMPYWENGSSSYAPNSMEFIRGEDELESAYNNQLVNATYIFWPGGPEYFHRVSVKKDSTQRISKREGLKSYDPEPSFFRVPTA